MIQYDHTNSNYHYKYRDNVTDDLMISLPDNITIEIDSPILVIDTQWITLYVQYLKSMYVRTMNYKKNRYLNTITVDRNAFIDIGVP